MPTLSADVFVPVSMILMVLGVAASLIPIMPGSLVVWGIALVAAILNGFERVTTSAMIVMTIIMLVSQLSDIWLPLLGMKGGGLSWQAALGAFAGGLIGTFVIPIPLLGTLIGSVLGALAVDYLQRRSLNSAVTAGREAARLFAIGYLIRLVSSVLIFIVYVVSIVTTS